MLTVPVGELGLDEVSVTVTVQVVEVSTVSELGEQLTAVVIERIVAAKLNVLELAA
jgi:hypothetical protein